MSFQFTFTDRFQKHYKNLSANEKQQLKNKLELLAENPMHPSLRSKRIQGTNDLYESSVNMDIRIILLGENVLQIQYIIAFLLIGSGIYISSISKR